MKKCILIKRAANPWDKPASIIGIQEFKDVLAQFRDVKWQTERGARKVRNSDGSTTRLQPGQGIEFVDAPGKIYLVYEFYDGIAVHVDDNTNVVKLAKSISEVLSAQSFSVPFRRNRGVWLAP